MTKIFSFNWTKQVDPLEAEEEALAASAGEYKDLEDGANGDETVESGGMRRPEGWLIVAVIAAYFMSAIGIYYLLLGSFYLLPEAEAAPGGKVIAIIGGVVLAVAGPVLAGGLLLLPQCTWPCRVGGFWVMIL